MNARSLAIRTTLVPVLAAIGMGAGLTGNVLAGGTFTIITDHGAAMDMTPDGTTVVGWGSGPDDTEYAVPYRWTVENGIEWLPYLDDSEAVAVSADGQTIAGTIKDESYTGTAGIWTAKDGWTSIGGLGPGGCDFNHSSAYGLSHDGSVMVGLGWDGCDARAFRWTPATGMVALLDTGGYASRANAISGNGQVIGGWDPDPDTSIWRPAVWDPVTSAPTILSTADGFEAVESINVDGTIVGGYVLDGAFLWSQSRGFTPLGRLPDSPTTPGPVATVRGITPDGSTAVGWDAALGLRPFVWTEDDGMKNLQDMLDDAGIVNPPSPQSGVPVTILGITAVSDDGYSYCGWGYGTEAFGDRVSWYIRITPPCGADLDGDGTVGFVDLLNVLGNWGPCDSGSSCDADIDGDGDVGFTDLLQVLGSWGACPK